MSSEMRECPFCGNQPRSGWQGTGVPGMDDCGYWGIDCCNAFAHADTEAEALAQWNRRSDAPNGSWLWCKLMDFCQKRRFPPAEFNDLFAIVTEAHELNNRALLARTEAGADRPVAEISELSGAKLIVLYSADEIGHLPKGTKLYTRPQDASGDADVAVAALREIYETGMYPEGHTLAGEHAYKGEYHADCIGIAERALAAMQAKEAK